MVAAPPLIGGGLTAGSALGGAIGGALGNAAADDAEEVLSAFEMRRQKLLAEEEMRRRALDELMAAG